MSAAPLKWSPQMDAALIAAWGAGDRIKTIAFALGLAGHHVMARVDRLVIEGRLRRRNRRWSPADNRVLLASLAAGIGYGELASVFDCSRFAVKVQAGKLRKAERLPLRLAA
jgi:hypothetical protein